MPPAHHRPIDSFDRLNCVRRTAPRGRCGAQLVRALLCAFLAQNAMAMATSSGAATATFSRIQIGGNTAIPSTTLDTLAAEYQGRAITDEELQTLRKRIDEAYARAGFRTSRAVIPDQDIAHDSLHIEVVEAGIERIEIVGAKRLDVEYLKRRIGLGLGVPLDVDRLNDNLRLLILESVVENLHADFTPGAAVGRSVLRVTVEEGPQYSAGLRVANDRSPTAGGVRGAVETGVRNLFARGDQFDFAFGKADGLRDLDLHFRTPLNSIGTELAGRYFTYHSKLVEDQFAVLDAETKAQGAELGLSQALWRRSGRQIGASLRFTTRQSESFLRGERFSFSPGADNGRLDVKAARLGLQWLERGRSDVLSVRYTWSLGLRGLGGTEHDGGVPDSSFHTSVVQAQWLHTFGPRAGSVFLRGDWQDADSPLLSLEKFSVGGFGSVRGYRRARVVRDNGWAASIEYRLPLYKLAVPGIAKRDSDGQLSFITFIDAGRAWNEHDAADSPHTLLAAGPGLRWDASREVRAEVYWGAVRRHLKGGSSDDIQDEGIHFALSARRGF